MLRSRSADARGPSHHAETDSTYRKMDLMPMIFPVIACQGMQSSFELQLNVVYIGYPLGHRRNRRMVANLIIFDQVVPTQAPSATPGGLFALAYFPPALVSEI